MYKLKIFTTSVFFAVALIIISCRDNKPFDGTVNFELKNVPRLSSDFESDTTRKYDVNITYYKPVDAPIYLKDSVNKLTNLILSNWFKVTDYIDDISLGTVLRDDMNAFFNKLDSNSPAHTNCKACRSYELKITALPAYQNKVLISLIYDWYIFEGGAHPNYAKYCINLRKSDGKRIFFNELVKDEAGLLIVAEKEFRKQSGITDEEPIPAMYNFKNDKFHLSENFAFTTEGLVFYYNPYEIAPFSAGLIKLTLSYPKISDYINYTDNI